jgi:hypothetical protein
MISKLLGRALLAAVLVGGLVLTAYAAGGSDLQLRTTKPGATAEIEKVLEEGKVVVSVTDTEKKTILGLGVSDFTVSQAGKTGKIISVQPMTENVDLTRHIVLVLDNLLFDGKRNAIQPLLAGSVNY